jgi:hypothetical protein
LFFSFFALFCKKDESSKINNPGYCIGTIVWYKTTYRTNSHIDFTYQVSGKLYESNYSDGDNGWSVPDGNYNKGDRYMVQYEQTNPSIARLLFAYPVKDSTDYKKYVDLFKMNPPE